MALVMVKPVRKWLLCKKLTMIEINSKPQRLIKIWTNLKTQESKIKNSSGKNLQSKPLETQEKQRLITTTNEISQTFHFC